MFKFPEGVVSRWASYENPDGAKGAGGKERNGRKGAAAVSPQLDSIRIFFRHIENINNSAANGKLSRFLYLRALFITHFHQLSGKLPLVYR